MISKLVSVLLSGLLLFFSSNALAAEDGVGDTSPPALVDGQIVPSADALGEDYSLSDIEVYAAPETPVSSASGIKGALLKLVGAYDPPVVIYTYTNYNGSIQYVREIVPDYPFFAACLVLLVFLYGAIRMGCALCRR